MIVLGGWILICFEIMSHPVQLFRRIEGIIGMPALHELRCILPVKRFALALPVRAVCPALYRTLVGLQTAPDVRAFLACCEELLGLEVDSADGVVVAPGGRRVRVRGGCRLDCRGC